MLRIWLVNEGKKSRPCWIFLASDWWRRVRVKSPKLDHVIIWAIHVLCPKKVKLDTCKSPKKGKPEMTSYQNRKWKITIATSHLSGKNQFFNQPIHSLQPVVSAWTRVVSGVPWEKFKVKMVMYRVAAWRLGPSGQRCPLWQKSKAQQKQAQEDVTWRWARLGWTGPKWCAKPVFKV